MIEQSDSVVGGSAEYADNHEVERPTTRGSQGETDLTEVVKKCLKRLHFHLRCAGINLRTALSLDLPLVATPEEEVTEIITNLMVQSMKCAENGGALQMSTFQTDGRDPRLGSLPVELSNCPRLAVVEVRVFNNTAPTSTVEMLKCNQAVFQTENDSVYLVLPV
tara:strand:+ start:6660 stop:7151 length:492 start_codon:yes stop_codon:yes gene_type:complete